MHFPKVINPISACLCYFQEELLPQDHILQIKNFNTFIFVPNPDFPTFKLRLVLHTKSLSITNVYPFLSQCAGKKTN